ncbi:M48 family metalloprotease [Novispirillum sp. DQ9]|uniref:M48 family metalloprotease n=1 Tax=Novispirillum sp. DQ9 TaxID=3398612 RepID=UPI003C7E99D7
MTLSRRHFLSGAAAVCGSALCGCAQNPAGRSALTGFTSVQEDVSLGRQEHPKLLKAFGGAYEDRRMQRYVDDIGKRLAARSEMPDLPYTFTVANSPIVNAFALPGGPVTVTRGLMALCESEAELAGVIGHEIGHVTARHSAERQGQQVLASLGLAVLGIATGSSQLAQAASVGAQAFLMNYSREQEMEADTLGARYLDRANYDVSAMASFLGSLGEQSRVEARSLGMEDKIDEFNMMASHPRTVDRVQAAIAAAEAVRQENPAINRDAYLDIIDGMLFGDDPEQGLALGTRFVHPGLRFEFQVPDGFRILNSSESVMARHPNGAVIVFDMGKTRLDDMRRYIATQWVPNARLPSVEALEVGGMAAATGATRGTVSGQAMDLRFVAIAGQGQDVYRFVFATPPARTQALGEGLRRTTYSFRRLTSAEAAKVQPLRLRVVRPAEGASIASLARGLPYGRFNEDWFRVLNSLRPGQRPQARGRVKVVA